MRTFWLTVSVVVPCLASTACATFDDYGLAKKPVSRGPDAAVDASACQHAHPAPMSTSVTVVAGDQEFIVAFHKFGVPQPDGGIENIGFDLDNKCTGEGEGPSCKEPPWAGAHPDGPGGRDTAVTSVFYPDADTYNAQSKQTEALSDLGVTTLVLRVRHYNGTNFDSNVEVDLFAATRSPDYLNLKPNPPLWQGNDVWKASVEWISPVTDSDGGQIWSPEHPKYTSSKAYVNDNVLVAHFDQARNAPAFSFSDTWIQARLEDGTMGDGQWAMRGGVYAGRLKIDDALANLEYVPDQDTGADHTCTDSPSYPQNKKNICAAVDISFSGDDPLATCDAASWAWTFEADPAKLSNDVDFTKASDFHRCSVGLRPSEDSCATFGGDAQ